MSSFFFGKYLLMNSTYLFIRLLSRKYYDKHTINSINFFLSLVHSFLLLFLELILEKRQTKNVRFIRKNN